METIKKLTAISVSLGMMLLFAGAASAGPDVSISITNSNSATVSNSSFNGASTGDNSITAEDDVEGGLINTGDADASTSFDNDVNTNDVEVDLNADSEGDVSIENDNVAGVENGSSNAATTGDNSIESDDEDVEGGEINTGDADAGVDVENDVNENTTDLDISDSDDLDVDLTQGNEAGIFNGVGNLADTGLNSIEADEDVEGGEINTGDADASTSVSNTGSYINSNRAEIDASGSDDLDLDVDHFNELGVDNEIGNSAFTSENSIFADDEDVEGGEINTGDADASVDVETQGNENGADLDLSGSDDVEGDIEQDNHGGVGNGIINVADTGLNSIDAEDEVQDGEVNTGDATSSENVVTTLNRNVVRFR